MNKFDRVISILVLLQTKKVITASEIAEKFDISLRTVYRDIRTLEKAGVPIVGEAGVGYSIMEGYRLPPVMFNQTEAVALLTAEKFIGNLTDAKTEGSFLSAMEKVKAVLRSDEKNSIEVLDSSIATTHPNRSTGNDFLQDVLKCVASKHVMCMHYAKLYDKQSTARDVEPVGCYYNYNNWYLIAYCRLKADYRTFRISRIEQLRSTNEKFVDEHPSLHDYLQSEAETRDSELVVVRFTKETSAYAGDKYTFGFVKEEVHDEYVDMTFLTSSIEYIGRWLISYGKSVQILESDRLRNRIKELVQELHSHYN